MPGKRRTYKGEEIIFLHQQQSTKKCNKSKIPFMVTKKNIMHLGNNQECVRLLCKKNLQS